MELMEQQHFQASRLPLLKLWLKVMSMIMMQKGDNGQQCSMRYGELHAWLNGLPLFCKAH
jgi:hypothetical protein